MKSLLLAAAATLAMASFAHADDFTIQYSGQGTSGTAQVTGTAVGGGEYDLTGGTLMSDTLGTETLVLGSGVFSNSNGDQFSYDNRLFVPANASASPDGANLTYAGGIVFQTAGPSNQDVYFSAANEGANNPTIFYFAGYDRSNGNLDSFDVSADAVSSAPEPGTWALMMIGVGAIGAMLGYRKRVIVDHKEKLVAVG